MQFLVPAGIITLALLAILGVVFYFSRVRVHYEPIEPEDNDDE
jgi:hypothetical protein